jgi:hypothetical protein
MQFISCNSQENIKQPVHLFTGRLLDYRKRMKTAGTNAPTVADNQPGKGQQPGKSFAGRVLGGRLNSRGKTFAGS